MLLFFTDSSIHKFYLRLQKGVYHFYRLRYACLSARLQYCHYCVTKNNRHTL